MTSTLETLRSSASPSRPRRWARASASTAMAIGALIATPASAHAASNRVLPDTSPTWIYSLDHQVVAVEEARTDVGAPIIQWDNTGGDEQLWYRDEVADSYGEPLGLLFRNVHSNLCMATDGVAGDGLFQAPCNPDDLNQLYWIESGGYGSVNFGILANLGTGLVLDVWGASGWRGAPIDLWWANSQWNQAFCEASDTVSCQTEIAE